MSLSGTLLGLINIAIVVVLLLIIGVIAVWLFGMIGWTLPGQLRQLYLALVVLIALYMVVALIFGLPSVTLFRP